MMGDRPLRIGVDARCLNTRHLRGIGKYLSEIMPRIDGSGGIHWRLLADRPEWPLHVPRVGTSVAELFVLRGYRFHAWEQIGLPWRLWRSRVDLLHCPGTTLPWMQPAPTVVTLHDTLPWESDEPGFARGWYVDRVIPAALRKCAAVITGSDSARRDIVRLWPALAEKLVVIPHGVDAQYVDIQPGPLNDSLRALGVREPYLLFLGGGIARKRFSWAIKVFEALQDQTLQLVACGFEPDSQTAFKTLAKAETQARICFAPFIAEADVPRLYQNAVAVLYPTLYEGFGFPALESQAVGTPVLFSPVGSLAELIGPGAEVLPSEDLEGWLQVCRRLVAERRELCQPNLAARRWAAQFSWEVSARRHLDVYRRVIAQRKATSSQK